MSYLSPQVFLIWAFLAVLMELFLVYHIWSFDRFKCLRWNHGRHSGTFKRVMTYTYLLSIPLFIVYSVGFTVIKYNYGYTVLADIGITPTPFTTWNQAARNAIFPLYLAFSVSWGCELVTHLEELCFWLFLVYSTSAQDWFRSGYFKSWAVGSCIAFIGMPLIAIITRNDDQREALIFVVGGLASISLTVAFLPVLQAFPNFLANLKAQGVETSTLVRLTSFHELNYIRVVFRFLFSVPFIILGAGGIQDGHLIYSMFLSDFLAIMGGIGCIVSSGITLVIFFPRSIEGEMALKEERRARRKQQGTPEWQRWQTDPAPEVAEDPDSDSSSEPDVFASKTQLEKPTSDPALYGHVQASSVDVSGGGVAQNLLSAHASVAARSHERVPSDKVALESMGSIALKPNRLNKMGSVELGAVLTEDEVDLARARSRRDVVSLVHGWRSPIDIVRPKRTRRQRHV